jgi:hypothetical protein
MLAVLDDHSKYSCVHFVCLKSDVAKELKDVITMFERQLGRCLSRDCELTEVASMSAMRFSRSCETKALYTKSHHPITHNRMVLLKG